MRDRATGVCVGVWLLGLLGLVPGAAAQQQDWRSAAVNACTPDGFVATFIWSAARGDVLVLATAARQPTVSVKHDSKWRFRALSPGPGEKRIAAARLSADASYVELTYENESLIRVDLTRRILRLPETASEALQPPIRVISLREPVECETGKLVIDEADLRMEMRRFMERQGFPPFSDESLRSDVDRELKYFGVHVNEQLYAPVLQLFKSEEVRPSAFEVWNDIVPAPVAATRAASKATDALIASLFRNYQLTSRACVIYHGLAQDPGDKRRQGSWVVQYWLYYPFDVGGVGAHLHDSEHLFVEVDKLGGTVRRVAAAGHGLWAPNNIYNTYRASAVPVTLPLFAIVEYGKHATAPDIDGDGWFTPGVDANNYYDAAKVWGVRDTIGATDSNLKSFAATMMVKREPENALIARGLHETFPDARLKPSTDRSCELRLLPETVPGTKCDSATAQCARSQVGSHDDFKDSEKILKPALYPPFAIRFGYSRIPTAQKSPDGVVTSVERSERFMTGFSFELARVVGGMPGRAVAEAVIDPRSSDGNHLNGLSTRYEMLTSNLTGLYAGMSWITDDLDKPDGDGPRDNRTFWLSAGGLLEIPLPIYTRRFTFQPSGGLTYNNFFRLSWEARAVLNFALFSPNRDFGIKAKEPNPY